jgi:hypothetical protein
LWLLKVRRAIPNFGAELLLTTEPLAAPELNGEERHVATVGLDKSSGPRSGGREGGVHGKYDGVHGVGWFSLGLETKKPTSGGKWASSGSKVGYLLTLLKGPFPVFGRAIDKSDDANGTDGSMHRAKPCHRAEGGDKGKGLCVRGHEEMFTKGNDTNYAENKASHKKNLIAPRNRPANFVSSPPERWQSGLSRRS